LLIEFLFLPNQVGLASVHHFVISDVILKVLHDFDAHIKIMLRVTVDELAYVLALVGALLDDVAVVLEQVVDKELVEIRRRRVMILVYLSCQCLTEDKGVDKTSRHRLELPKKHE
jgi:hypothetical protein